MIHIKRYKDMNRTIPVDPFNDENWDEPEIEPFKPKVGEYVEFSHFINKIFTNIEIINNDENIIFTTSDNEEYNMHHNQDCCEVVYVDDIIGDINDLIGNPILLAKEDTNRGQPINGHDSVTWTFYNISTIKGHITIRWFGGSNGYYSESVYIQRTK